MSGSALRLPAVRELIIAVGRERWRFERVGGPAANGGWAARRGTFAGTVGRWRVVLAHEDECAWSWTATDGEREMGGDRPLPTPILCVRELLAMAAGGTLPDWRPRVVTSLAVKVPDPEPPAGPTRVPRKSTPLAGRADLHRCDGCGTWLAETMVLCRRCFRRARMAAG